MRISRVLSLLAAVTVAISYVAVANAGDIAFFYVAENEEVKVAQDVHYTLTDASGAKILDESVSGVVEGVRISNIAPGIYTVAAEQPSTGYFGMKKVVVTEDSDEPIVLGPDGVENAQVPGTGDVAPAVQQASTVQTLPVNYATPSYGVRGLSSLGAIGAVAGIVGGVLGITLGADDKTPVSQVVF
ncbi:MAG: hypothetical protein ACI4NP_02730 [Thermoguttaceae bacterium]